MWHNGKCMSRLNAKNKDKPCTRDVCTGSDFCRYHRKYGQYFEKTLKKVKRADFKNIPLDRKTLKKQIKDMKENLVNNYVSDSMKKITHKSNNYLNKHHLHGLMGMTDSWENVPIEYRIKIDNYWWDVRDLVRHFSNQLNSTNMENPSPTFFSNPFNRNPIKPEELHKLKERIQLIGLNINVAVKAFLLSNQRLINECYKEACDSSTNYSYLLNELIYEKCRWRIVNDIDSQGCFTGCWVKSDHPLSEFEMLYDDWKDEPYQTINVFNEIIDNPRKNYLFEMLKMMDDNWSISDSLEKL